MSRTTTTPRNAAPLAVAVIVPAGRPVPDGAKRLLDRLCSDARYDIAGVWEAVAPAPTRPIVTMLEARIVPMPAPYVAHHWTGPAPAPVPDLVPPCDVIVDFSHDPAADHLEGRARFGLWRLSAYAPGGGENSAMAGHPATRVTLFRHAPEGTGTTLAQAVYDTKFAARRNAGYVQEKSVQLVIHALALVHRDGALPSAGATLSEPEPRPGLAGYAYRTAAEITGRVVDKLRERAGGTPGGFGLRVGFGDITDFEPARGIDLPMPRGHFWADPFLMEHDGSVYCLFEDYNSDTGLGEIGAGRLTETGMDYLGRAHVMPHHLSFPYLFRHQGEIYMMPETHQAGRLEIWRATEFPLKWTLHATAFEGTGLADSLIFEQDGTWWILTGYPSDGFGDFCGELYLFRTSGPDMAWMAPHPLNPVVIGADTARGGGRVHKVGGRLLRVSQDNSGGVYGWGLNIMEITRLAGDDYAERRVRHVTPDFAPGLIGAHHFDCAGGRWVMDLRRP